MSNLYQIYLISDATGETLDRIFTAIKAQFRNINYKIHTYSFTRTENQILKILEIAEKEKNSIMNLIVRIYDSLGHVWSNHRTDRFISLGLILGFLVGLAIVAISRNFERSLRSHESLDLAFMLKVNMHRLVFAISPFFILIVVENLNNLKNKI